MDQQLDICLMFIRELHCACLQQESTVAEQQLCDELNVVSQRTRLDYTGSENTASVHVSKAMAQQISFANEAFQRVIQNTEM